MPPTAAATDVVPAANDATPMTGSTEKCIPAMCIDPIIKGVLERLPDTLGGAVDTGKLTALDVYEIIRGFKEKPDDDFKLVATIFLDNQVDGAYILQEPIEDLLAEDFLGVKVSKGKLGIIKKNILEKLKSKTFIPSSPNSFSASPAADVVPAANDATPMTMSAKKCIPEMCIDAITHRVLPDLPDVDFLNTIRVFLGNPEKNEEIFLPKQCLLNLLLKRKWEEPSKKALEHALTQGHVNIVEFLLDNGETIHRVFRGCDAAGHYLYQTPLSIAIKYGHLHLVKHLVEKRGASMDSTFEDATFKDGGNMTSLMYASCLGDLDIVKYLVEEKGVNIDTSFEVNCRIYDEWDRLHFHREFSTALIHAVKNDHLHIVQYLVEKGAKINDDAFSYINPVVFAAHLNNTEIVKYLVENGADYFISWGGNREYDTPVISALKHNNLDMVQCIVKKEIISKEKWGKILYQACYDGFQNHEIVKYLHYHDVGMNKREFEELIEYTNDAFLEQRW